MQSITSIQELSDALEASKEYPVVLYIHSSECHTSAAIEKLLENLDPDIVSRTYKIVVQTARDVVEAIEDVFDMDHESPQTLLVFDRILRWHDSHRDITLEAIEREYEHFAPPSPRQ